MTGNKNNHLVDVRLSTLRDNVLRAVGSVPLTDIAMRAEVEIADLHTLIQNPARSDLYVVARLENALGVHLWPSVEQASGERIAD
ncbi:hypothetical protein GE115_12580 [Agromyces sp. CFH 90414]|uniref:XRE family transcriptional regulator n=1 Tax=Agromyces agglutinans TaxID=2662258 RepID=A0A6I2FJ03_9MICO|nr:hypothetical protein [Agromyces agglutinans]MRG60698.1 hypothetical protein [Agromyces agglutinans]